jgi:hypothetical protein
MVLRILLGGLSFLIVIWLTRADERRPPSLDEDAKVLAGKWEPTAAKGAAKVVLQFDPAKAIRTLSLTVGLYKTSGKAPRLIDSDRGEVTLQKETSSRFFVRHGTKVRYVVKEKKLVLDGEYEANGILYLLTGEWKKVEESK